MERPNILINYASMGLVRSIAEVLCRLLKRNSISSDPRHDLGRRGEGLAAQYLRRMGYKVIHHNYRAPNGGEVDLVCRDRDTLVFVEVKTRSSDAFGTPAEAVTSSKQQLIARGALAWLKMLKNPDIAFRFDIAEVRITGKKAEINVIQNAFVLPEPYRY